MFNLNINPFQTFSDKDLESITDCLNQLSLIFNKKEGASKSGLHVSTFTFRYVIFFSLSLDFF